MTDRSLLDRILRDEKTYACERHEKAEAEPAAVGNFGCFGWLSNPHDRADMLELRLKTGAIGALPYAWIDFVEFEPSAGVTLHARGSKVSIKGRNLNAEMQPLVRLVQGIIHRRVPWIREADRGEDLAANESATVVEAIKW